MKESFAQHTDFGMLASRLKNDALQAGHDPQFTPNGPGYAMTCTDCGRQTHIEPHGEDWHALASPAHRLHMSSCAGPTRSGSEAAPGLAERLRISRQARLS